MSKKKIIISATIVFFSIIYSPLFAHESLQCKILKLLVNKGNLFEVIKDWENDITIIDTFGFFSPECISSLQQYSINLYNDLPSAKLVSPNIIYVSGIATGRYNSLAISFLHKRSNFQKVYYINIMGDSVNVVKVTSGFF